jgi:hypothetical protein
MIFLSRSILFKLVKNNKALSDQGFVVFWVEDILRSVTLFPKIMSLSGSTFFLKSDMGTNVQWWASKKYRRLGGRLFI